jgi:hypothetical protein
VSIVGRAVSSASFQSRQLQTHAENETNFVATFEPSNATAPVTYTWDFGDGSSAIQTTNAVITYEFDPPSLPYTFTVELTVENGWGPPVTFADDIGLPFDDDGDGLSNVYEWTVSFTDPHNPDTDDDGRTDYEEVMGYVYDGYPDHPDYGHTITTDPNEWDSDSDGMSDGEEFSIGTHPNDPDTDADGLLDGEESGLEGATDPLDPDSDDDGLLDGEEVNEANTNPLNAYTDGDGIDDYIEVDEDSDPNNALDATRHPDTDGDGIRDARDLNSDDDGVSDAGEWSSDESDLLAGCTVPDPLCLNNDIDGDGIWNFRDVDSDDDGVNDVLEFDADHDGVPDDTNEDGIPDWVDPLVQPERPYWIYMPIVIRGVP